MVSDGDLRTLAQQHDVYVAADNRFQREARLLQALWREDQGYPAGTHRGRLLGSRLRSPEGTQSLDWARGSLVNFLTPTIREVVWTHALCPEVPGEKLFDRDRLVTNLLSSQPLCFNLFAELEQDLGLASQVMEELTGGRIEEVTDLQFEYSPERRSPRYTDDGTAFDVYMEYTGRSGRGFAGIEVKYHENLADPEDPHRCRYTEIARKMNCFGPQPPEALRHRPLQQMWRDHLLAGSIRQADADEFEDGFYVFLYPAGNEACTRAVRSYHKHLSSDDTFMPLTLEACVEALRSHTRAGWVGALEGRYLNFAKLGDYLSSS